MTRIMVDGDDGERDGWFDQESATFFEGRREWDGANMACVHLKDGTRRQHLYRTRGGRWVIQTLSQWSHEQTGYMFVSDDQARDWLILNENDAVVEKYFGEIEEEVGPGRPTTGTSVKVNIPPHHIADLDTLAAEDGTSRADQIRKAVAEYLSR